MKLGPDKDELRIRRSNYGHLEWSLAVPSPAAVAKFRRWNLVLIAFLAFLVLGVFVVAEAPTTGNGSANSASASFKENESPASLPHSKSIKGVQPGTHGQSGSGDLNKDFKGAHRTG